MLTKRGAPEWATTRGAILVTRVPIPANFGSMFPALLTTILFALSAVCASRTTKMLGGTEANFFRVSLATLLLAGWAHLFGTGWQSRAFIYFFLSGCVGFGVGDLALYQALPRLGSRLSMILVHCLAAPFGAAVEWLWLGTRVTGFQIGCGAVILAGIAVALSPERRAQIPQRARVAGTLFGIVAGCGQGYGAVLSRKAYQVADSFGENIHGIAGGMSAAYQRIIAGWIIAAAFYLVTIRWRRTDENRLRPSPGWERVHRAWPWVIGNALAGPIIGVSCYQWALTTTPTAIVLPVVAITPLVVIPLARWAEGDRPGFRSLVGAVIAVAGVGVLTWTRFKR